MIPIDLHNADEAGYQIFYFLIILQSCYLICFNFFQSTVKFRVRLYKLLKFLNYFVIIPLLVLWILIAARQYFLFDFNDFKMHKVYWKAVGLFMIMVIFAIDYFGLKRTITKALSFLKKNDRNEVKYQALFKKTRSIMFVLIFIDIAMVLFFNNLLG